MLKDSFLYRNKVFLTGLLLAVLTSVSEAFTNDNAQVRTYTLLWAVSLAVLSYLANNLRGQVASIMGMLLTTAAAYFAAHSDGNGLDVREVMVFYVLPFAIKCISLFNTAPPKDRSYEHAPAIVEAKAEGAPATEGIGPQGLFNNQKN